MFSKYFINKYIVSIQEFLESDNVVDFLLNLTNQAYSESNYKKEDYKKFKQLLTELNFKIDKNPEYSKLLNDGDGYVIPFSLGWVKLQKINNSPMGLTVYFKNYSYKLYLDSYTQSLIFNTISTKEPSFAKEVRSNLKLA